MGKAKDGSECYTRTKNSGEIYVTCKGTQRLIKKKAKKDAQKTKAKVPAIKVGPRTKKSIDLAPPTKTYAEELKQIRKKQIKGQKLTLDENNVLNQAKFFAQFKSGFESTIKSYASRGRVYPPNKLKEYRKDIQRAIGYQERYKKSAAGGYGRDELGNELIFEDGSKKYYAWPRKSKK
tara:strand:- start:18302 stop:18835 length:534 start_codon:yes stop_codon:yes gene_type:complete